MRLTRLVALGLGGLALVTPTRFTGHVESQSATEAPTGYDNQTNGFVDQPTFDADRAVFEERDDLSKGLGPVYNAQSCAECHQSPVTGATSQISELRAGHFNGVAFVDAPGGSLINDRAIDASFQERVPGSENVRTFRMTTNALGDGFVECIDSNTLVAIANGQPSSMRGQFIQVPVSEAPGNIRAGRFGWKNQHASLVSFAADAYLNEMGITTSSCTRGVPNRAFATENRANRAPTNAIINGCPDDQKPGIDDDFAGENNNCSGGRNELQDDVANFTFFMAHLAPPAAVAITAGTSQDRGRTLFNSAALQCSGCHRTDADIFVSTSAGGVPSGIRFAPYSDFLIHDMGTAGDGIGNAGDSVSVTHRMRTAPLWGLRSRNKLMHDGGTTDRQVAIQRHAGGTAGQGTAAANAFNALTSSQKTDLVNFLQTL